MKNPLRLLAPLSLLAALPLAGAGARIAPGVEARLAAGGERVPVLVALEAPQGLPLTGERIDARRPAVSSLVERALEGLGPSAFTLRRRLANTPAFAGDITRPGLEALRNRPGVLAISLDGVVHPAGQLGTAQIGADRLTSLGVTGYGRSVAIVDTGIDVHHPDLGGGDAPSPRILGGWNFADNSADYSDCDGHGTSVAGVVGGPLGVAPEASFVALRVFGTADGCRSASFSDVLAAVDWAVTERSVLRIEAINLSLSDDRFKAGFCDAEDPAAAGVFAAARASGIAVLAASGNDGRADGLGWPACFSDVTAVGMVYSTSIGATSWGGAASCRDALTAPDIVPCASNSGSALGLLAPGVGWVTPTSGGGQTSSFSGTSAAVPAATAAVLLTRQARLTGDPALAVDLLRATGVPVQDAKNGRTTPRVDLSAAFDATSPVTGPCGSSAVPGEGTDVFVCEANVSSLVGSVSNVAIALSLDHPDPSKLLVTLTGPDGTSVVVMRDFGSAGQAVREVFGRTTPSVEALSRFAGHPAEGTWSLRIADTRTGGDAGHLVSWTLLIEPGAPPAGPLPVKRTAVIPAATHRAGKFGSFFTSDVRLFNSDLLSARSVSLRFLPLSRDPGDAGRQVTLTIPPLGTRVLTDLLANVFRSEEFGPVFVDGPPQVFVGSRTQSTAVRGGAYGLFIPSIPAASALAAGATPLILVPPFPTEGFRVNLGLTEVNGETANVEVSVKDRRGAQKGMIDRSVPPLSLVQVNDVYQEIGAPADGNDRIEVRVTGGKGRVIPFATAVDNQSNDGLFVSGASPVTDLILPATARAAGLYGATFRTDLKLANPSALPVRVKISYFPTTGPAFPPLILALGGNETRLITDVLGTLFAPTSDASGALRLTALDGDMLVASSRTYTGSATGGSYGLTIGPVDAPLEATPGRKMALAFISGSGEARTNAGFLETSGLPTRARLTLYAADGTRLGARDLAFEPYQAVQWNDVFAQMEIPPRDEASGILEVLEGGSLVAHVIQINNRTNDASFIPGALLP